MISTESIYMEYDDYMIVADIEFMFFASFPRIYLIIQILDWGFSKKNHQFKAIKLRYRDTDSFYNRNAHLYNTFSIFFKNELKNKKMNIIAFKLLSIMDSNYPIKANEVSNKQTKTQQKIFYLNIG
jgi:hypothetical protein